MSTPSKALALLAALRTGRRLIQEQQHVNELLTAELRRLQKSNAELARHLAEVLRRQALSGELLRLNLSALTPEQREDVHRLIDMIRARASGQCEGIEMRHTFEG